jgi:hypothetical protein
MRYLAMTLPDSIFAFSPLRLSKLYGQSGRPGLDWYTISKRFWGVEELAAKLSLLYTDQKRNSKILSAKVKSALKLS